MFEREKEGGRGKWKGEGCNLETYDGVSLVGAYFVKPKLNSIPNNF